MPVFPLMGVCPSCLGFELTPDNRVTQVRFSGGCPGNLEAISRLVEGLPAEEVIAKLSGITCGKKPTSCPDQLSRALRQALDGKQSSPFPLA